MACQAAGIAFVDAMHNTLPLAMHPRHFFGACRQRLGPAEYNSVVGELKRMSDSVQTKQKTLDEVGLLLGEGNRGLLAVLEGMLSEMASNAATVPRPQGARGRNRREYDGETSESERGQGE